ncbi:MAG: glycosyltransferase family 39 protein [bacterium]
MRHSELLIVAAVSILLFALLRRNRSIQVPLHRLCLLVIILGAACRVTFCIFTPTFYAPDEEPHFNYIRYLYENRSFPVQTVRTGAPAKEWEYYQPPLYYLLSVPIYTVSRRASSEGHHVPVRMIRLLSILMWGVNVILVLRILDNLRVRDVFTRTFVVSMVCLLPSYTSLSSTINNDNLLIAMGGAILYLMSRNRSYPNSILLGILLGFSMLTKLTAIVYAFAIGGMLLFQWTRRSLQLTSATLHFILILLIAGTICSPWAWRNLSLYGGITAERVANVPEHWPSMFYALVFVQRYMKESFWSAAGIHNNIRFLPEAGVYLSYFAFIGLLYGLFSRSKPVRLFSSGDAGAFLMASAAATAANIALLFRFGILYGQAQGRFLFPMLMPISLFTAIGIGSLGVTKYSRNAHVYAVGFFVAYILSFTSYTFKIFAQF